VSRPPLTLAVILSWDEEDGWEDVLAGIYPMSRPIAPHDLVPLAARIKVYERGARLARKTKEP
jgi:hypothetical protein